MRWNIRCKAIQSNEHYGIKKNHIYSGVVVGDNADEAAISIRTYKCRILYFADEFRRDFVLVSCRNSDTIVPPSSPCDDYDGKCWECPNYDQEFGCID